VLDPNAYEPISVSDILTAAWATAAHRLTARELGTWAAIRELLAQRNAAVRAARKHKRAIPTFVPLSIAEVANLRGCSERRTRREIRALERSRVVIWNDGTPQFTTWRMSLPAEEHDAFHDVLRELEEKRRGVAVPFLRDTLRFLARSTRPQFSLSAIAIVLRTCWRKGTRLKTSGKVRASWVKRVLGVGTSSWHSATRAFAELGLIEKQLLHGRERLRDGVRILIPHGWRIRSEIGGVQSGSQAEIWRVNQQRKLSELKKPETPAAPGASASKTPDLRRVVPEDLASTERTMCLYAQAVARGLAQATDHGRLLFLSAVEHARAHGKNPVRLFISNLLQRRAFITQSDEDHALERLRRWRSAEACSAQRTAAAPRAPECPSTSTRALSSLLAGVLEELRMPC
jgi:hypothetical protein